MNMAGWIILCHCKVAVVGDDSSKHWKNWPGVACSTAEPAPCNVLGSDCGDMMMSLQYFRGKEVAKWRFTEDRQAPRTTTEFEWVFRSDGVIWAGGILCSRASLFKKRTDQSHPGGTGIEAGEDPFKQPLVRFEMSCAGV